MLLSKQEFHPPPSSVAEETIFEKDSLVGRSGITQTPVLFENFKKLWYYRIGWDRVGWKPSCPVAYKAIKYIAKYLKYQMPSEEYFSSEHSYMRSKLRRSGIRDRLG